jgi:hypothetical protein
MKASSSELLIQIYGFQAMKRSKLQDMTVNRSWSVSPLSESNRQQRESRLSMKWRKRHLKSTPWR